MKPSEKAEVLIQQAQAKGQADFQQWKEGYLARKLKHKSAQEARKILREKYTALEDWYSKHSSPKPLFDVANTSPEELARAWASCFRDWEGGLIPLPGRTPEYSAEAWDTEGNILGPFIPASWLLPLAERFKVAFCLEYLDRAISDKLEVWHRKKLNEIAFSAKLAIRFMAKQGRIPETAILEALAAAKADSWEAGGRVEGMALPAEAQEALAAELLRECRGLFSEDELTYLQKRIDSTLQRKPQQQEASTKIWAMYYWYLWQAGYKPELHAGSGKKEALAALAQEHGISAQKLGRCFNAVGRNSEDNPKKQHILEAVIPMLAAYPEAQAEAQKDLAALQKRINE